MNLMLENRSYSENSNNKTNIQRHHLSYRHQHRGKTTMSVTNEERLAELVCTAQRESGMLKHYLQKRQWLPHPECDSEKRRQTAMNILERVLCQWVASLHSLRPKKTGGNAWHRPRVTLVPFGSFRLQAHRPDSDLDVLCLCPDLCSRSDFFSSLPVLFEATAAIQDVHPIQFAYTPVIKMTVCGIAVDLLFGRVAGDQSRLLEFQQRSPSPLLVTASSLIAGSKRPAEYYMIQDLDLVGIDESMMRSFNGVRVTQFILDAVPDRQIFRALLCSVKEWATVQGIYSNTLGFLGGINFAILCAWICKRYPKLLPASLLRMFFRVYATWEWPKPVTLCEIQDLPPTGVSKMPAWNPETNPRDATHVMPIITPVYPSMNSSYNVGIPQQRRIQEEFHRAVLLMGKEEKNWRSIYYPTNFFERHANYLVITIRMLLPPPEDMASLNPTCLLTFRSAANPVDFMKWHRLCESRLRILMSSLDSGPEVCIYPFAQFMKRDFAPGAGSDNSSQGSSEESAQEALLFVGLRFASDVESLNLKQYASEFLYNHLNAWEGRKPGMDFLMTHVVQEDLPFDLIEQYIQLASASPASLFYSTECDDSTESNEDCNADPDLDAGSDDDISAMMSPMKRQRSGTIDNKMHDSEDGEHV